MTKESTQFIAEALRRVKLEDSFSPADIGRRIGFSKPQSEITARLLADAGVLELGFDCTASFSPEYQEMKAASDPKPRRKRPRS